MLKSEEKQEKKTQTKYWLARADFGPGFLLYQWLATKSSLLGNAEINYLPRKRRHYYICLPYSLILCDCDALLA